MTSRSLELGPFANILRSNLSARRRALELTAQDVADRTRGAIRPIGRSAVSEVERGARRVDVDDLVALALALETSPMDLLTPPPGAPEIELDRGNLVLFTDQTHQWLQLGGDVRDIVQPSDPLEAELVAIRTELSHLKEQEANRGVLIDVLHLKLEKQSLPNSEADEVHHMLADETRLRQKDRRRREHLERRRLELQQAKRGGDT